MDDKTVPETPYGSVESYAEILRRVVRKVDFLDTAALALVDVIAGDNALSDAAKVHRIRNVVAAAKLVDAADPTGQLYSRADDGEATQPIAGRIPPHFEDGRTVVEVAGGLVEVDPPEGFVPASAPYATFAEQRAAYEREEAMRLPRCPNCRGRHHADEPCR